jgi:hypothetical protein
MSDRLMVGMLRMLAGDIVTGPLGPHGRWPAQRPRQQLSACGVSNVMRPGYFTSAYLPSGRTKMRFPSLSITIGPPRLDSGETTLHPCERNISNAFACANEVISLGSKDCFLA